MLRGMVLLFGALTIGNALRAGSGPAVLSCVATEKALPRLTLKGVIPHGEIALDLTLEEGANRLVLNDESGSSVSLIDALAERVFTMVVRTKTGEELELYALPSTIKFTAVGHREHATFAAVLRSAPKPGLSQWQSAKDYFRSVSMSCSYHWEV